MHSYLKNEVVTHILSKPAVYIWTCSESVHFYYLEVQIPLMLMWVEGARRDGRWAQASMWNWFCPILQRDMKSSTLRLGKCIKGTSVCNCVFFQSECLHENRRYFTVNKSNSLGWRSRSVHRLLAISTKSLMSMSSHIELHSIECGFNTKGRKSRLIVNKLIDSTFWLSLLRVFSPGIDSYSY